MRVIGRCAAALAVLLLAVGACREAGLALGPTPAEARSVAEELFGALERRFGPHAPDPALLKFRARVVQASFAPSRLFADAAAWQAHDGRVARAAYAGHAPLTGRYRLTLQPDARPPTETGDYRGQLSLHKLGNGDYEWTLLEELAVGRLRASAADEALARALRAIEHTPPEQATAALRAAWPRTAEVLARLVALDHLHLQPHTHGGTRVFVGAHLRTAKLAAAGFPAYARFLDRYVVPLRYKFDLKDAQGSFGQFDAYDGRLLLNFHVRQATLAPLTGAARPLPEHLRLTADFSAPAGLFRVGVAGLQAELHRVRGPREHALETVFHSEPRWLLPFIVRPLLRASLRRPFEDPGARLVYALREPPAGPTLLVREYRVAVRESWLVRWLGGLGVNAVEAFRRDAEEQADRFNFELLDALRRDLLALVGP